MNNKPAAKKMLVFHSAYTYDYLKAYGMEIFVQGRDAGDFFKEVLTISPMASLQYSEGDSRNHSKSEFFQLDSKNRILEGRITRYHFLRKVPALNFLISQNL